MATYWVKFYLSINYKMTLTSSLKTGLGQLMQTVFISFFSGLTLASLACLLLDRTSESKLNNFTRVEPILNLLGIPFDTNRARDIMTERHGEATKLMYQLFIALNKKQKAGLTGTAMETMRPAAPAKLDYMKSLIYKEV
mgnify:FL=1